MTDSRTKHRWGRVLAYAVGVLLPLSAAVVATLGGAPWYISVSLPCAAMIIILSKRRIFRPNVTRTAGEIVCRYVPWHETTTYMFFLAIPLMGIAMTAAGRDPANPTWLQVGGIILLGATLLLMLSVVYPWRRSFLRISPSTLTLRLGALGSKPTGIRRDQIESITLNSDFSARPQAEIAYLAEAPDTNANQTVILGAHLTIRPINLLNALTVWNDSTDEDPDELLDRIEYILRDRSLVDV